MNILYVHGLSLTCLLIFVVLPFCMLVVGGLCKLVDDDDESFVYPHPSRLPLVGRIFSEWDTPGNCFICILSFLVCAGMLLIELLFSRLLGASLLVGVPWVAGILGMLFVVNRVLRLGKKLNGHLADAKAHGGKAND